MDQKNFIVAIVLSVVIIMGWQTLFPAKPTPPPAAGQPDDGAERAGQRRGQRARQRTRRAADRRPCRPAGREPRRSAGAPRRA